VERVWKLVFNKNVVGRPPIVIVEKCSTTLGKDGAKIASPTALEAEDYAEQLAVERGWDLVAVEEI